MSSDAKRGDSPDLSDDEIDIEIRPARNVAARAIVLATVLRRVALESTASAADATAEGFDLREWLRGQDLLHDVSPLEQALLERPVGSISESEIATWSWQGMALAAIAWALRIIDLGPPDTEPDVRLALATIPSPWDTTAEWLRDARLRTDGAIAAERERVEIWHWRATAEDVRRAARAGEQDEVTSAIAQVVAETVAAGVIPDVCGDDFTLWGEFVHDLSADALDELQMATGEQLRALNWLCGFGRSWDEVPLDV
jgi:hypothetical protein